MEQYPLVGQALSRVTVVNKEEGKKKSEGLLRTGTSKIGLHLRSSIGLYYGVLVVQAVKEQLLLSDLGYEQAVHDQGCPGCESLNRKMLE